MFISKISCSSIKCCIAVAELSLIFANLDAAAPSSSDKLTFDGVEKTETSCISVSASNIIRSGLANT